MIFSADKDRFLDMFDEEAIGVLKEMCRSEAQAKRIYKAIAIEVREEALDLCICAGSVYQRGYEITDNSIRHAIGNALEMKLGT